MTDFLTRIAERTLGVAKVAQPIIAPLFAPVSPLPASEPAFLAVDEVIESPAQMQKARRPNVRVVPPHPSLVTRIDQQAMYTPEQSIPDTTGNHVQSSLISQSVSEGTPGRPQGAALHVQVPTPSVFEQHHVEEEKSVTPAPLINPSAQLSEAVTLIKEQPINAFPAGHVPPPKTQEQHLRVPFEEHTNASHQDNHPFTGDRPIGVNVTGETSTSISESGRVPTSGRGVPVSARVPARGTPTMDEHPYDAVPSMVGVPLAGTLSAGQGTLDNAPILSQHISESSAPKRDAFLSMEEHLLVPRQDDRPLIGDHPYMSPTQNIGATRAVALEDSHTINQHTTGATEVTSPTPTIHVTIGRIDVRAITPPSAPPTRPKPARSGPTLSLEDYTRQNRGGR
jgi:hypothetical protein